MSKACDGVEVMLTVAAKPPIATLVKATGPDAA